MTQLILEKIDKKVYLSADGRIGMGSHIVSDTCNKIIKIETKNGDVYYAKTGSVPVCDNFEYFLRQYLVEKNLPFGRELILETQKSILQYCDSISLENDTEAGANGFVIGGMEVFDISHPSYVMSLGDGIYFNNGVGYLRAFNDFGLKSHSAF